MRSVFVYILSGETSVLYTGVTNDLVRRIEQHRAGKFPDTDRIAVIAEVLRQAQDDG